MFYYEMSQYAYFQNHCITQQLLEKSHKRETLCCNFLVKRVLLYWILLLYSSIVRQFRALFS